MISVPLGLALRLVSSSSSMSSSISHSLSSPSAFSWFNLSKLEASSRSSFPSSIFEEVGCSLEEDSGVVLIPLEVYDFVSKAALEEKISFGAFLRARYGRFSGADLCPDLESHLAQAAKVHVPMPSLALSVKKKLLYCPKRSPPITANVTVKEFKKKENQRV
ncbi:dicer-like protein 2 [Striga asiatica]|uniref:Dicer-like protein 2 n=1 Tax=Striga asiatica TaxID=4170 RepID=A0A5A7PDI1_STRAF|nr:dicer-like protein 2 [Striga asiatica]